jgi:hypothetical protein
MRLREANCNTNSGLDNFLEKNKDQKEGLSTEYLVYAALDLKFFDILETLKDRQNCQHLLMFILQLYVHFVPNLVGPSRDSSGFTQMNGQGEKRVGLRVFFKQIWGNTNELLASATKYVSNQSTQVRTTSGY